MSDVDCHRNLVASRVVDHVACRAQCLAAAAYHGFVTGRVVHAVDCEFNQGCPGIVRRPDGKNSCPVPWANEQYARTVFEE